MKVGSLFSGYGGLSLAVERIFDAEIAWHCEFEDAPSKVLEHHWPGVPNLGDITKVDWSTVPPVDIIDGGSPCQDLSAAGRRAGMTDGTRSNLWVNMREAIAQLKPKYVVWENVRGAYSATATSEEDIHAAHCYLEQCEGCVGDGPSGRNLTALGRVLGDLHDLGFDAEWCGIRASDVGAPHGRFRVFVLATRRETAAVTGGSAVGELA
ncbi:DNA cytosine methyltransferase [Leucobacter luti]|nr:DNA cytosine methyltransferase [Leucobacter luti]